ncbi:MAG: CPBP family intramembrane metalloprotease [Anaerolineae bacterium]|nr:CPBP family intramembrane metalloprotease [Anaerolineae bacterium]
METENIIVEDQAIRTQPKFNLWLFLLLCAIAIPAGLAVIPYSLALTDTSALMADMPNMTESSQQTVMIISVVIVTLLQTAIINWPLTALGLLAAARTDLGAPILSALTRRQKVNVNVGKVILIGCMAGILLGAVALYLSEYVFGPLMEADIANSPLADKDLTWTWWEGLLASFGAGVNEEITLRLFLLTGLAWVGNKIARRGNVRPTTATLWVANIISALIFSMMHFTNMLIIEMPFTVATVGTVVVLNGMLGLTFGWLYWKYGLESAIVAHFMTDVVMKVVFLFIPL